MTTPQPPINNSDGPMPWRHDDGGRKLAGFKADETRDCVARAIAIATGAPYRVVYDSLNFRAKHERPRNGRKRSSARTGVSKRTWRNYMDGLPGWRWVACMSIGSGCKVHLRTDELPKGRLIVSVSRHLCAVVDGVLHDTHDCSRGGTRCVYGYYEKVAQKKELVGHVDMLTGAFRKVGEQTPFDKALAEVRRQLSSGEHKHVTLTREDAAELIGWSHP